MEARCIVGSADRLGEGPVWSPLDGRVYWFDIKGKRLAWYEPKTDERGAFDLPFRASAAAPRTQGGLLIATEKGLAICDPDRGEIGIVQPLELPEGFRTNDGKIDLAGNFWWSTMDDDHGKRPGSVYRTTPTFRTDRVLTGIHIPNTISVSPDGRRLYMADSRRQTIFRHEIADLGKVEVFAHTRGAPATPDGSAVDARGYLWNAQWGGWRIVRYAPNGEIAEIIQMPVEQPTSCCFGGDDFTTLYVTSAWDGLSLEARARQPVAGGLFAIETGVKGLALPLFAG
ncbi:SMP-30/gluconolactonase/LRE family protein [Phenylobacterium sp.]|uniref:SMP-30/gluconolactonase/LRE family protein n=1 Tax=Phenylobacterium sp. TaxID=1871053 RepID=UPI00286BC5BF|nr:SMP-30/gluconolactonase/LRE family protein [Phenylobacterium sp.]